jgi:hypothetical protein
VEFGSIQITDPRRLLVADLRPNCWNALIDFLKPKQTV